MNGSAPSNIESPHPGFDQRTMITGVAVLALFLFTYYFVFRYLYFSYIFERSYYTHGFLVPLISGYIAWTKRDRLRALPIEPCLWGYPILAGSAVMLLVGGYLGLRVIEISSLVPIIVAIILILFSLRHALTLWFPIIYLFFMIPMPPSLTSGAVVSIKLFATEQAVQLAQLSTLPMIRSGSYIVFGDDQILVGEVCGGLRSLIALLAFGTLMAYISQTAGWARWLILFVSGPIAIVSNVVRIFALCLIAYFFGSETVEGTVHDVSGILIFAVAFFLLFSLEALLRKIAPKKEAEKKTA